MTDQSNNASRAMSVMANQIRSILENLNSTINTNDTHHKEAMDKLNNILTALVSLENRVANLETKASVPKRTGTRVTKSDAVSNTPPPTKPTKHTTPVPWFVEQYSNNSEFILKYVASDVLNKQLDLIHSKPEYVNALAKLNGLNPNQKLYSDDELSKAKLTREEASKYRQNVTVIEIKYVYGELIKRNHELNMQVNKDHKLYLEDA